MRDAWIDTEMAEKCLPDVKERLHVCVFVKLLSGIAEFHREDHIRQNDILSCYLSQINLNNIQSQTMRI